MVGRDRRNAAPVVDAGLNQLDQPFVVEVGRRLYRNLRRQHDPRRRDHAQEVVLGRLGRFGHLGAGLGAEVLDDDFLQVPMRQMHVAQREQRFDALLRRLADADEDARGHRHSRAARRFERGDAQGRHLVWRAVVRGALFQQALGRAFQHQPAGSRDGAEHPVIVFLQQAGVDVRQEARFLQDQFGAVADIVDRARKAALGQPFARGGIAALGRVAEREQRFLAAGGGAFASDLEHFLGAEVGRVQARGCGGERAVVADVGAEPGQRDEDLGGIGHAPHAMGAIAAVADHAGFGEDALERCGEQASNQFTVSKCHVILSKSGC